MNATILGIDIGGTKTAVVLGSPAGSVRWRKQFAMSPGMQFAETFQELSAHIEEGRKQAGADVVALSVSIGGPLDVLRGIIRKPPHLPAWEDIPLKKLLSDRFGLPVYVEHDGNAGALAEFYFGAGRGFANIIFLTMGTGFGAGLILGGKLYRGTTDVAGEVGHIRIAEDGPLCYGKRGSLEGFASGTGIALLAREMFPARYGAGTTTADLYRDYGRGDAMAKEVFGRASFHLGRGFALLADILNPERIILGGLGVRIFDALVEPALQVFESEALPESKRACTIVPAQLGEAIGDYASLCAALDQGGLFPVMDRSSR